MVAGYEALDNELQSITNDSMIGKTFVDKLVKVKSLNGKQEVILIHIEIQAQKEEEFSKRLFQYYCKLFLKYDQSILTLAILTNGSKSWHPKSYEKEIFYLPIISFNFWTHKLLDYGDKKHTLEASNNPFAIVVLVHLIFLETKKDLKARFLMKLQLTRRLYDRGWGRDAVINLLKVIDWALVIPKDLEVEYKQKLHKLEQEKGMSYVTSFERLSREEGLQQGQRKENLTIAKRMLTRGYSREEIKEITQLCEQDLLDLEDRY